MNYQKSHFLGFDEVASALGVSVKKLRASLNVSTGVIDLGGTVPPIRTLKLGHLRVVGKGVLDQWLAAVGAITNEEIETNAIPVPEVEKPAPRRGRPRKAATARAGEPA